MTNHKQGGAVQSETPDMTLIERLEDEPSYEKRLLMLRERDASRDAAIRIDEHDALRAALKEIIALEDRGVGVTLANDKLREAQAIAQKALIGT